MSAMKGKPSSAYFEVWVDDVKQYTSPWMDASTPGISLKIPIVGASEVKLVTTDANHRGNESDHTVWADAKCLFLNMVNLHFSDVTLYEKSLYRLLLSND